MTDVFRVQRVMTGEEARALIGDVVPEKEPNCTQAGLYVDADTDEPVFLYLPLPEGAAELRAAVRGAGMGTTRRSTGLKNASRSFGMTPRRPVMQRNACRATSLAADDPAAHHVLVHLGDVFSRMMEDLLPEIAAHDRDYIEQVLPDWRLTDDSLWTSGVINRSSELPYHLDRANFPTWSAMPVVRRHMRGGYLDLVEYDLVCACRDSWVTFFLGNKYVHGVTPMRAIKPDAYRYSIVYYALSGMKNCFETAIEQARGKADRTEREDALAESLDITTAHEE